MSDTTAWRDPDSTLARATSVGGADGQEIVFVGSSLQEVVVVLSDSTRLTLESSSEASAHQPITRHKDQIVHHSAPVYHVTFNAVMHVDMSWRTSNVDRPPFICTSFPTPLHSFVFSYTLLLPHFPTCTTKMQSLTRSSAMALRGTLTPSPPPPKPTTNTHQPNQQHHSSRSAQAHCSTQSTNAH